MLIESAREREIGVLDFNPRRGAEDLVHQVRRHTVVGERFGNRVERINGILFAERIPIVVVVIIARLYGGGDAHAEPRRRPSGEETMIASSPKCSLTIFMASAIDGALNVFSRIRRLPPWIRPLGHAQVKRWTATLPAA